MEWQSWPSVYMYLELCSLGHTYARGRRIQVEKNRIDRTMMADLVYGAKITNDSFLAFPVPHGLQIFPNLIRDDQCPKGES